MDSGGQNIPPRLTHRCREVAAFHPPLPGRNLPSCGYTKPLPLSAVQVSTDIRSKGQPRAEACLKSVSDKCLAGQATNEQYIPPSLSGERSLSTVGLQDQILYVHTKILSANYFDTAKVQITSERRMSLENKKNDF